MDNNIKIRNFEREAHVCLVQVVVMVEVREVPAVVSAVRGEVPAVRVVLEVPVAPVVPVEDPAAREARAPVGDIAR